MTLVLHAVGESQNQREPEIYESIQGEGLDMGLPTFFVRLQGCQVHCFFCDEKETWVKRENNSLELNPQEILDKLEIINPLIRRVTITGGEPTEQKLEPLISLLAKNNYKVSIETAATGTHSGDLFLDYGQNLKSSDRLQDFFPKVLSITFSPKEIYSKSTKINDERIWHECDQIKFVIANQEAIDYLINTIVAKLEFHNNPCPIFLVPDWYNFEKTKSMIQELLHQYPSKFRMGIQMHKMLDMP